jgi:GNAT superfamily N-acetyltransferase
VGTFDAALIAQQMTTDFYADERGRLVSERIDDGAPAPHVVVVAARSALVVRFGVNVPDEVCVTVEQLLAGDVGAPSFPWQPTDSRDILEHLERTLGPCELAGGPSYVIPKGISMPLTCDIETYDGLDSERLRGRIPDDDLAQTIGPWAVVLVDGVVASKCSTSRSSPVGVEAGLFTYPEFRGRGFGAAATAAWAKLVAERTVFYYTWATNTSSQRVMERLAVPPFAWWWKIQPATPS